MCRIQCLLAFFALIGAVQSWDLAITNVNQIELYTNKTIEQNVGTQYNDLTALAYDAVQNMLLFVDRQNDNGSIFSYHLATKKYQRLVRKRSSENIHDLAYDPVDNLLFFTDTLTKSIYSRSLKTGESSPYGNLWLNKSDQIPMGIAVDSCRGYVYWTNVAKASIQRARFDGSDSEVIIDKDITMPESLAIDQHTNRIYWIDDRPGIHFSVESFDLDGPANNSRVILYMGQFHSPKALTVSKYSVYWIDWDYQTVWKLPKIARDNSHEPQAVFKFEKSALGIAANYLIQDQIEGNPECERLSVLSSNRSVISESFSVPPEQGLLCVHGEVIDKNKQECKCHVGYTGDRCDTSVCHNYCLGGDCRVTSEGVPTCSCKVGFSGTRCETDVCTGFCLNYGQCSLNDRHEPTCTCQTDFEGVRCEAMKTLVTTTEAHVTSVPTEPVVPTSKTEHVTILSTEATSKSVATFTDRSEHCNCTVNATKLLMYSSEHTSDGDFVMPTSCNDGWDAIRDPILMVLGTLCGFLCLGCAVLFTKILQLKKRPRIKKRIIVNKNVTPMTARPDQCEITIENCCNMNICETPCFEPRSTIRPTLLDSKPGKEEKKNLIANMEYPEDY